MAITISSNNLEVSVNFSNEVNSGRNNVGHQQIARFLASMEFIDEDCATLEMCDVRYLSIIKLSSGNLEITFLSASYLILLLVITHVSNNSS